MVIKAFRFFSFFLVAFGLLVDQSLAGASGPGGGDEFEPLDVSEPTSMAVFAAGAAILYYVRRRK